MSDLIAGEKLQVEAVIFDMDGVLLESEQAWDDVRHRLTLELGGSWKQEATRAMMGMSSVEWSGYMHSELGVPLPAPEISARVVEGMREYYRQGLPLIPGSRQAVERMAERWPLGLASSSNRELIDLVLAEASLTRHFRVTVSSEEVARGKPHPDVYLEVAGRIGVAPAGCVAVEDSGNGIRAGHAAGMRVIAFPNRDLPPEAEALSLADAVIRSLDDLTAASVMKLDVK